MIAHNPHIKTIILTECVDSVLRLTAVDLLLTNCLDLVHLEVMECSFGDDEWYLQHLLSLTGRLKSIIFYEQMNLTTPQLQHIVRHNNCLKVLYCYKCDLATSEEDLDLIEAQLRSLRKSEVELIFTSCIY